MLPWNETLDNQRLGENPQQKSLSSPGSVTEQLVALVKTMFLSMSQSKAFNTNDTVVEMIIIILETI